MIIFINGSFGVGKTVIAQRLETLVPNALLYDPEEVGMMLRNILQPIDWTGDFQDYPMWRTLVVDVGKMIRQAYGRTLIMPMTIWKTKYFEEVLSGIKSLDTDVRHFCLTASVQVIRKRLLERGENEDAWVFDQIENCVSSFQSPLFEEHVDTTNKTPEQITSHILAKVMKTASNS
jgi:hypothetical protein